MLQEIGFVGLIMIEVRKVNDDLCVIEANPRLWGPLQLLEDNANSILSEYVKDSLQLGNTPIVAESRNKKENYFWFNGLIETLVKHKRITNFTKDKSILLMVLRNILHDVYLRKDTRKIFFREFRQLVKG